MVLSQLLENIHHIVEKYDFIEEQKEALLSYCKFFNSKEELHLLGQKYYHIIFDDDADAEIDVESLKENDNLEQGMLFAVIYLARLELLGDVLEKKGIPAEYAQSALWHYKDLFQRNFNCYSTYGFNGMYRAGMIQYIKPMTFRLGRLCFEMTSFSGPYTVYRNKKTGEEVPILNEGLRYLNDGKQAPKKYEGDCFVTTFSEEVEIKGYTVDAEGKLNFTPVSLSLEDYEKVLEKNDSVISVHIPGNEKMTPESVMESFKKAKEFFELYYKEKNFKAFVCSSWLLDTGLKNYLKPESNILSFQRSFKIVLSFVNTFAIYWNIFGIEKFIPYYELVPKNSLQKNLLEHIEKGGYLYSGNGYILL